MRITFLGTDSVLPIDGDDTASYLIDDHTVIDTGFGAYQRLRAAGADPQAVSQLLMTHFHPDHYLGLPGLLFGIGHGAPQPRGLRIYGPAGAGLADIVERTLHFLDARSRPHRAPDVSVIELSEGDVLEIAGYQVHVGSTKHGIPTLAYRFERQGKRLATICGDSAPHPPLVEFARGSELLVHEAASSELSKTAPAYICTHSTPSEAAQLAAAAQVGTLAIVHFPKREAAERLRTATPVFAHTIAPQPGEVIDVDALARV